MGHADTAVYRLGCSGNPFDGAWMDRIYNAHRAKGRRKARLVFTDGNVGYYLVYSWSYFSHDSNLLHIVVVFSKSVVRIL